MSKHFKAFDQLKAQGFFIGEFIWNFADFKTAQSMLGLLVSQNSRITIYNKYRFCFY
jgi:hypothetical protein